MYYQIIDKKTRAVLFSKASKAETFFQRFRGLMGRDSILKDEALIFFNATSIHTFFMRFSIDIVFLDHTMKVVRIANAVKPGRIVHQKKAFCTIECRAFEAFIKGVSRGQELEILSD